MYVSNPDANPNVPSKDILITKNDYIVSAPNETLRFREMMCILRAFGTRTRAYAVDIVV